MTCLPPSPWGEDWSAASLRCQISCSRIQVLHSDLVTSRAPTNLLSLTTQPTGRHVATNPNFKGNLKQIDEEFLEHIQALMTSLLHPRSSSPLILNLILLWILLLILQDLLLVTHFVCRNLVVKSMGGKEVKAKEIVQYYKSYMEIFKVHQIQIQIQIQIHQSKYSNLTRG